MNALASPTTAKVHPARPQRAQLLARFDEVWERSEPATDIADLKSDRAASIHHDGAPRSVRQRNKGGAAIISKFHERVAMPARNRRGASGSTTPSAQHGVA